MNLDPLIERIDALLPQTQCRRCGYDGCRPYAEAIARGEAGINQCPPGGDDGIEALAPLLGVDPKPLNPEHGVIQPRCLAVIDEEICVGCTRCLQVCPVDAIVGAPKLMHTVIAFECTGCALCLAPCPVDCILMVPDPEEPVGEPQTKSELLARKRKRADRARMRFTARRSRLRREMLQRTEEAERKRAALNEPGAAEIAAAIERAKARKQAARPASAHQTQQTGEPVAAVTGQSGVGLER